MSNDMLMALLVIAAALAVALGVAWLRLHVQMAARVQAEVSAWRDRELAGERARLAAQLGEDKRLELAEWKRTQTDLLRQDAIQRSQAVVTGRVFEQLVPYLPGFGFNPRDARFLGSPIDFVVFDGLSDEDVKRVVFVEVKTGGSTLSTRERRVRDAIKARRVEWLELRLPDGQSSPPPASPDGAAGGPGAGLGSLVSRALRRLK